MLVALVLDFLDETSSNCRLSILILSLLWDKMMPVFFVGCMPFYPIVNASLITFHLCVR